MDPAAPHFRLPIPGIVFILVLGAGCGEDVPLDDAATLNPDLLPARADYRTVCSVCHGIDGTGARYLFPPLQGSEWMASSPEPSILAVLHGLEGPLEIRGEEYMNKMPPPGPHLSDERIAGILTYVRASWGNHGSAVTPEHVARIREKYSDRKRPWAPEELLPLLIPEAVKVDSVASGS